MHPSPFNELILRARRPVSIGLLLLASVCVGCDNPELCELVQEKMWCGGEPPKVVAGEQPQPGAAPCACGDLHQPPDNVIDDLDFAAFSACVDPSAPNEACPPEIWSCADFNQDGKVDGIDFSTFQVLFHLTPDGVVPPECLVVE